MPASHALHPACSPTAIPHLNDSPTQPRHVCEFLKSLCIGVVVLSKLCLHDLVGGKERSQLAADTAALPAPSPAPLPAAAQR